MGFVSWAERVGRVSVWSAQMPLLSTEVSSCGPPLVAPAEFGPSAALDPFEAEMLDARPDSPNQVLLISGARGGLN